MVGPTVHPPLVDVLIRFRCHRIALIADVSRMYRAILLTEADKDYVDDYLGGADSPVNLQGEMHDLLYRGGFLLRKWSSK